MQRPIKFRAWDRRNNKLILPEHFQEIDWTGAKNDYDYKLTERLISADGRVLEYTPEHGICEPTISPGGNQYILMQYTGLKDKNGKEIYEGDIIKTPAKDGMRGQAIWDKITSGFRITRHTGSITDDMDITMSFFSQEKIEVIGNIYENVELLESKK